MHDHSHHDLASERIGWAFFLNLGFSVIEFIGGALTGSTAIMADAVHDLGDSLSIGLAWGLNRFGRREPSERFNYGFRRFTLMGGLINGLVLLAGSAFVLSQAVPRLFDPAMPMTEGMLVLALFGIGVNGFAAWKLSGGKSLNERMLNWHMLEDLFGWVAVLIVAIVLMFVEWPILDPLLAIAFTILILVNVVRNLNATARVFLQAAPDPKLRRRVFAALEQFDEVDHAHHLHFWSLDGEHHVLTAHLALARELDSAGIIDLKARIASELHQFDLAHTTIELEMPPELCRDERG